MAVVAAAVVAVAEAVVVVACGGSINPFCAVLERAAW